MSVSRYSGILFVGSFMELGCKMLGVQSQFIEPNGALHWDLREAKGPSKGLYFNYVMHLGGDGGQKKSDQA